MDRRKSTPAISSKSDSETHTYKIDKKVFIVTPFYRENSGKTVHEILLNLMEKETEKR